MNFGTVRYDNRRKLKVHLKNKHLEMKSSLGAVQRKQTLLKSNKTLSSELRKANKIK